MHQSKNLPPDPTRASWVAFHHATASAEHVIIVLHRYRHPVEVGTTDFGCTRADCVMGHATVPRADVLRCAGMLPENTAPEPAPPAN